MSLWYGLIFLGTLLEGELTLLLGAIAVFRGHLSSPAVMVAAAAGAYLGDWFWFEVGRKKGSDWLDRWSFLKKQRPKIQNLFVRFPVGSMVFLRIQIGLRTVGNLIQGAGPLSRSRFLCINGAACLFWATLMTALCIVFVELMVQLWGVLFI